MHLLMDLKIYSCTSKFACFIYVIAVLKNNLGSQSNQRVSTAITSVYIYEDNSLFTKMQHIGIVPERTGRSSPEMIIFYHVPSSNTSREV